MPRYSGKKLVKKIEMFPNSKRTYTLKYYNKGEKVPIYDYEIISYKKHLVKCQFIDTKYQTNFSKAIEVNNTSDIPIWVEVYEILTTND